MNRIICYTERNCRGQEQINVKKEKKESRDRGDFCKDSCCDFDDGRWWNCQLFCCEAVLSYKFAKEKKKEVSQQLEKENKDRVDVALMQAGDMMTIRVYHSKNNQMVYIPLRSDMVLNLTDDGKRAVEQELERV